MVRPTIWKACILAALACLAALPGGAACPSDNADDGHEPSSDGEPCDIVKVDLQPPDVDPHPECIKLPP